MTTECTRLRVTLDWRDPASALRVLLGSDVRRFMRACAAADRRLIQIEPFVPFGPGPAPGPAEKLRRCPIRTQNLLAEAM